MPWVIARCSTIGPSASAGKKVKPPTMRITPTTSPTKSPPVVGIQLLDDVRFGAPELDRDVTAIERLLEGVDRFCEIGVQTVAPGTT